MPAAEVVLAVWKSEVAVAYLGIKRQRKREKC